MAGVVRNSLTRRALPAVLFLLAMFHPAIASADEPISGWPRVIELDKAEIVIYQPQLESFEGNILKARAAFSVTPVATEDPTFGVAWSRMKVATDLDTRTVRVLDLEVTDVRFPEITDEQKSRFAAIVKAEIPRWDMTLSLDRLLAALEIVEQEQETAKGLKVEPPKILYASFPAVLVTIDGEPILHAIEDEKKLERVINTPFLIILDKKSKLYWLDGGGRPSVYQR